VPCKGAAIPGLSAEFFSNTTLSGPPAATRIDTSVNFEWNNVSPAPGVPRESYSVRWCGNLVPPVDGDYRLGVHTDGGSRLFLDAHYLLRSLPPPTTTPRGVLTAGDSALGVTGSQEPAAPSLGA